MGHALYKREVNRLVVHESRRENITYCRKTGPKGYGYRLLSRNIPTITVSSEIIAPVGVPCLRHGHSRST